MIHYESNIHDKFQKVEIIILVYTSIWKRGWFVFEKILMKKIRSGSLGMTHPMKKIFNLYLNSRSLDNFIFPALTILYFYIFWYKNFRKRYVVHKKFIVIRLTKVAQFWSNHLQTIQYSFKSFLKTIWKVS